MVMDGVAIERDGVIVGIGEPCVGKIPCELSWIVMATEEWVWFAMVMDEVAIERDGVIVGIGEPSWVMVGADEIIVGVDWFIGKDDGIIELGWAIEVERIIMGVDGAIVETGKLCWVIVGVDFFVTATDEVALGTFPFAMVMDGVMGTEVVDVVIKGVELFIVWTDVVTIVLVVELVGVGTWVVCIIIPCVVVLVVLICALVGDPCDDCDGLKLDLLSIEPEWAMEWLVVGVGSTTELEWTMEWLVVGLGSTTELEWTMEWLVVGVGSTTELEWLITGVGELIGGEDKDIDMVGISVITRDEFSVWLAPWTPLVFPPGLSRTIGTAIPAATPAITTTARKSSNPKHTCFFLQRTRCNLGSMRKSSSSSSFSSSNGFSNGMPSLYDIFANRSFVSGWVTEGRVYNIGRGKGTGACT